MDTLTNPVIQAEIQIRDEQSAVKLLEQAQYNINSNFLKIAEYLHMIVERELYREWGYNSIWEFIAANPKLEFERRTAEMLIRIWRNFGTNSTLPIPPKTLAEIGYTKSYFLTMLRKEGKLTKANLEEWIEKAKELSVREFKKEIDKALGKPEDQGNNWVSFSFRVPPEAMDSINEAIYEIARLEGIPEEEVRQKRGELLARIIEDWRGYYAPVLYAEDITDEQIKQERLKKIKQQIEGTFGVHVVFVSSEEDDF